MDEETRAQVAWGWEASGLSQAAYAAEHGISARTLRAWRKERHTGRQRDVHAAPVDTVRGILVDAIARLQGLLASVDAEVACRSAGQVAGPAASQAKAPQVDQRLAEPTSTVSGQKPGGQEDAVPLPTGTRRVKKASNFWDDMEVATIGSEPAKVPEPVVAAPASGPPAAGRLPLPFFTVFQG